MSTKPREIRISVPLDPARLARIRKLQIQVTPGERPASQAAVLRLVTERGLDALEADSPRPAA